MFTDPNIETYYEKKLYEAAEFILREAFVHPTVIDKTAKQPSEPGEIHYNPGDPSLFVGDFAEALEGIIEEDNASRERVKELLSAAFNNAMNVMWNTMRDESGEWVEDDPPSPSDN
jgi:hypothetical protein